METLKGRLCVQYAPIGMKLLGPCYYLQTARGDFVLTCQVRSPWQPDQRLEFYNQREVEVVGEISEGHRLQVKRIREVRTMGSGFLA